MRRILRVAAVAILLVAWSGAGRASIQVGEAAPAFTKSRLGGGSTSLSDYPGKVVVLFLLGYDCPFCLNDAPSLESDVAQAYAQSHPGQVQAIGVDLWNGTTTQLSGFRDATGVTFPLLLNGAVATGGNLATLYGTYDNYVVINKQGIVRYHAANRWPHGNRYHLNEIRGTIDSLVGATVGVEPAPVPEPGRWRLSIAPNPLRSTGALTLSLPRPVELARIHVLDIGGRRVATLHEGALPAGERRLAWDGRGEDGVPLPAGVYLVSAELEDVRLRQRVVKLR